MRYRAGCGAVMALAALYAFGAGEDTLVGVWTVQSGDGRVEISKAPNGTFEGKLVWIAHPTYDEKGDPEEGKPRHDRHNPDPAQRDRPIIGLKILEGFTPAGANLWKGGTVYDPKIGKTYKCKLTLVDDKTLDVHGFLGIALLGSTEHWTRHVAESK